MPRSAKKAGSPCSVEIDNGSAVSFGPRLCLTFEKKGRDFAFVVHKPSLLSEKLVASVPVLRIDRARLLAGRLKLVQGLEGIFRRRIVANLRFPIEPD